MSLSASEDALPEERWRKVRRYQAGSILLWMTPLYFALVIQHFLPGSRETSIPLGLVLAILVMIVANVAFRCAIMLAAPLLGSPVDTPPPPQFAADPVQLAYKRPPRIAYPAVAQARGQCGWVALRLRVKPTGRIEAYAVIDQAPGRTFERAVARSLVRARVEIADGETTSKVVACVVKFILPREDRPAWAQGYLITATSPGSNSPLGPGASA